MNRSMLFAYMLVTAGLVAGLVSCNANDSNDGSNPTDTENQVYQSKLKQKQLGLARMGIPMPKKGKEYKIDAKLARVQATEALERDGSREPFEDVLAAGFPLVPLTLQSDDDPTQGGDQNGDSDNTDTLKPICLEEIAEGEDPDTAECEGGGGKLDKCEKTCVTACASASASAVAFAYAEASVSVCAFASAWACVWDFDPFRKMCAYAESKACATAFAKAFGFGAAFDYDRQCKTKCTK